MNILRIHAAKYYIKNMLINLNHFHEEISNSILDSDNLIS
jgi:hypothetical protein